VTEVNYNSNVKIQSLCQQSKLQREKQTLSLMEKKLKA